MVKEELEVEKYPTWWSDVRFPDAHATVCLSVRAAHVKVAILGCKTERRQPR